ncbi:MAG: CPBP family intramembrane metalloprotease [Anaerolineales bacterium]|nr:CPBP family intramembrane metalloprotease [Anaerolineales bacterium]
MEDRNEVEQTVPWQVRDTIWGTLAALALLLALMVGVAFLPLNGLNLGLLLGFGELLYLLPVWWFAVRKYGVSWRALGLRGFQASEFFIAFGVLLASYTLVIFYGLVLQLVGVETPDSLGAALDAGVAQGWLVLGAALVAPFVEEIFFRGFLFAGLKRRFHWIWAALISNTLFTLNHLEPLSLFPVFVLGLALTYIYQRSRSIWPGVLMHTLVNSCALIATFYTYGQSGPLS